MTAALARYANPGAELGHAGDRAPVHADARLEFVTVQLSLPPDQALALAQFVKRCGWSDMRTHSLDDDEAYRMRDAIDKLRGALASAGYAPR